MKMLSSIVGLIFVGLSALSASMDEVAELESLTTRSSPIAMMSSHHRVRSISPAIINEGDIHPSDIQLLVSGSPQRMGERPRPYSAPVDKQVRLKYDGVLNTKYMSTFGKFLKYGDAEGDGTPTSMHGTADVPDENTASGRLTLLGLRDRPTSTRTSPMPRSYRSISPTVSEDESSPLLSMSPPKSVGKDCRRPRSTPPDRNTLAEDPEWNTRGYTTPDMHSQKVQDKYGGVLETGYQQRFGYTGRRPLILGDHPDQYSGEVGVAPEHRVSIQGGSAPIDDDGKVRQRGWIGRNPRKATAAAVAAALLGGGGATVYELCRHKQNSSLCKYL